MSCAIVVLTFCHLLVLLWCHCCRAMFQTPSKRRTTTVSEWVEFDMPPVVTVHAISEVLDYWYERWTHDTYDSPSVLKQDKVSVKSQAQVTMLRKKTSVHVTSFDDRNSYRWQHQFTVASPTALTFTCYHARSKYALSHLWLKRLFK